MTRRHTLDDLYDTLNGYFTDGKDNPVKTGVTTFLEVLDGAKTTAYLTGQQDLLNELTEYVENEHVHNMYTFIDYWKDTIECQLKPN